MELPSPGLHGNDGAEGCSVTEDFLHRVVGNRLSLRDEVSLIHVCVDVDVTVSIYMFVC